MKEMKQGRSDLPWDPGMFSGMVINYEYPGTTSPTLDFDSHHDYRGHVIRTTRSSFERWASRLSIRWADEPTWFWQGQYKVKKTTRAMNKSQYNGNTMGI